MCFVGVQIQDGMAVDELDGGLAGLGINGGDGDGLIDFFDFLNISKK